MRAIHSGSSSGTLASGSGKSSFVRPLIVLFTASTRQRASEANASLHHRDTVARAQLAPALAWWPVETWRSSYANQGCLLTHRPRTTSGKLIAFTGDVTALTDDSVPVKLTVSQACVLGLTLD